MGRRVSGAAGEVLDGRVGIPGRIADPDQVDIDKATPADRLRARAGLPRGDAVAGAAARVDVGRVGGDGDPPTSIYVTPIPLQVRVHVRLARAGAGAPEPPAVNGGSARRGTGDVRVVDGLLVG